MESVVAILAKEREHIKKVISLLEAEGQWAVDVTILELKSSVKKLEQGSMQLIEASNNFIEKAVKERR